MDNEKIAEILLSFEGLGEKTVLPHDECYIRPAENLHLNWDEVTCGAREPEPAGWWCTRDANHQGIHVAHTGDGIQRFSWKRRVANL